MKVLIATLFVLGVVLAQGAEHPMLGRHDLPGPEQAKAHPNVEDAVRVHPPPPTPATHPMLGQNDGHDNMERPGEPFPEHDHDRTHKMPGHHERHEGQMRGRHHKGHKEGHKGCRKHFQGPPQAGQPDQPIGMNTDAQVQPPVMLGSVAAAPAFVPVHQTAVENQMVVDTYNPTVPTEPWREDEEEEEPRHHRRPRCRWAKIVLPIVGIAFFLCALKKCCKNRRQRCERMRQQMMMNQEMAGPAIVPVQRSLPDQLAYHRQEAQRIEAMLIQQHQQHQQQLHPLNEPSFEPFYGQPVHPRY